MIKGDECLIRILIMDVDGTLTDGGIYYDTNGNELKKFNVKDGAGIKSVQNIGIKTMILTGRNSEIVEKRAHELNVTYLYQNISDKYAFLKTFLKKNNIDISDVAYIGDDDNDLECMQNVGFSGAPSDASDKILSVADYVCSRSGGNGAVREFCEKILDITCE